MKARSDSKLKLLSPERQEQIIEWCDAPKTEACVGGLAFALEQLAADGIKVSRSSLSDFYSWFHMQRFYERAAEDSEEQRRMMLKFDPNNVDRAEKFGDFCFIQEATRLKDAKTYTAVRNLRLTDKALNLKARGDTVKAEQKEKQIAQKDEEIALALRRVELLESNAAIAKEKLTAVVKAGGGGLSPETLASIEEAAKLL